MKYNKKAFLQAGKIVATHGVEGHIKIVVWCNNIEKLLCFNEFYIDGKSYEIEQIREYKNSLLVKFKNINTISQAQKLKTHIIYIKRSEFNIKGGSYFIEDLLGMEVYDYDNKERLYGVIKEVLQPGANDVYVVESKEKKLIYVPAIKQVVKNIDLKTNRIDIKPIEGLLDVN